MIFIIISMWKKIWEVKTVNFKNILVSALLISSITFVGCDVKEEPIGNKDEIKKEQPAGNEQEAEKKEDSSDLNYETTKKVLEVAEKNINIEYPQVQNYPGELLMDYMNQSLMKITDIYGNEDQYTDVQIDYEITKMDENILSVLFRGTGKIKDFGEINIKYSINLDMASSSNEIAYNNLIKDDEQSKEKVNKILNQKAKDKGLKGLEAEGIRIYFKGENVVFYYMPLDDSAKEFIELSVPLKDLEKYINTDFGEAPAS